MLEPEGFRNSLEVTELASGRLDARSAESQSKVHSTPSCHFPSVGKGWSLEGACFPGQTSARGSQRLWRLSFLESIGSLRQHFNEKVFLALLLP